MQRYNGTVQKTNGNAVSGAAVTVYEYGTSTLATLFSDNGTSALNNPVYSGSDGEYYFHAANGRYTLSINRAGFASDSKEVILFDPADAGIVSVKDYGAKGDGVTDDTAAIQAAIDAVAARVLVDSVTGFDAFGGVVLLPYGTYLVSSTITIKRGVTLRGEARRSTMILVDSAVFAADSRVFTLGELGVDAFAYNTRIEGVTINCAFRADLIAVESDHAAEGAGLYDVLVRGTFRPVRFYSQSGITSPTTPTEVFIQNCEFWLEGSGGPAAPRYAIDFDNCEQSNVVRDISIVALNDNAGAGSAGIRVNECAAEIQHVHCEKIERAVEVAGTGVGSCRVSVRDLEHYNGTAEYGVYISNNNAGTLVQAENIFVSNASTAYAVFNSINSESFSAATTVRLGKYSYLATNSKSQQSLTELRVGSSSKLRRLIEASASLNFGSIAAGAHETLTITATGAEVGDNVVGNRSGATNLLDLGSGALIVFHYGVTSANTVSVRAMNVGTSAGDPAAGEHNITVMGFT